MRIEARQHIPGFVDGAIEHRAEVDSLEALLALPWIAGWAQDDLVSTGRGTPPQVRPFFRWSTSNGLLLAEYDGGDHWSVVAHVTSDEPIPLPPWQITPAAHARVDRWNRGET